MKYNTHMTLQKHCAQDNVRSDVRIRVEVRVGLMNKFVLLGKPPI